MKRCLILIVIAVCLFPAASASETLSVAAKGAVLIDGTSGRAVSAKRGRDASYGVDDEDHDCADRAGKLLA